MGQSESTQDLSNYSMANQFIAFWIYLQTFNDADKRDHHHRVIPGTAKFKHPTSIAGLWEKYSILSGFTSVNFYDKFTWQFPFLVWCSIDKMVKGTWSWDENTTNYCYDNFVADLNMHDGDGEAPGIFGYYDMFTWEGYLDVWFWRTATNIFINYIAAFWIAILFVMYYAMSDESLPLCVKGDTMVFGIKNWCF